MNISAVTIFLARVVKKYPCNQPDPRKTLTRCHLAIMHVTPVIGPCVCLELVSSQTDVLFGGISCCNRCFVDYTGCPALTVQGALSLHAAVTWQVLLFRFEQGGVVAFDMRCHVLGAAVAHLDGVRVEDFVQD